MQALNHPNILKLAPYYNFNAIMRKQTSHNIEIKEVAYISLDFMSRAESSQSEQFELSSEG